MTIVEQLKLDSIPSFVSMLNSRIEATAPAKVETARESLKAFQDVIDVREEMTSARLGVLSSIDVLADAWLDQEQADISDGFWALLESLASMAARPINLREELAALTTPNSGIFVYPMICTVGDQHLYLPLKFRYGEIADHLITVGLCDYAGNDIYWDGGLYQHEYGRRAHIATLDIPTQKWFHYECSALSVATLRDATDRQVLRDDAEASLSDALIAYDTARQAVNTSLASSGSASTGITSILAAIPAAPSGSMTATVRQAMAIAATDGSPSSVLSALVSMFSSVDSRTPTETGYEPVEGYQSFGAALQIGLVQAGQTLLQVASYALTACLGVAGVALSFIGQAFLGAFNAVEDVTVNWQRPSSLGGMPVVGVPLMTTQIQGQPAATVFASGPVTYRRYGPLCIMSISSEWPVSSRTTFWTQIFPIITQPLPNSYAWPFRFTWVANALNTGYYGCRWEATDPSEDVHEVLKAFILNPDNYLPAPAPDAATDAQLNSSVIVAAAFLVAQGYTRGHLDNSLYDPLDTWGEYVDTSTRDKCVASVWPDLELGGQTFHIGGASMSLANDFKQVVPLIMGCPGAHYASDATLLWSGYFDINRNPYLEMSDWFQRDSSAPYYWGPEVVDAGANDGFTERVVWWFNYYVGKAPGGYWGVKPYASLWMMFDDEDIEALKAWPGVYELENVYMPPKLSKFESRIAAIKAAVMAAAVATTVAVGYQAVRNWALARSTLAQDEFSKASTAYAANKTPRNFRALNRANKKLQRSYSLAGSLGVTGVGARAISCGGKPLPSAASGSLNDLLNSVGSVSITSEGVEYSAPGQQGELSLETLLLCIKGSL